MIMVRTTAQRRSASSKTAAEPPATRQVALTLPHGSPAAGPCFESALETLSSDLSVHKLWQGPEDAKRQVKPRRRS